MLGISNYLTNAQGAITFCDIGETVTGRTVYLDGTRLKLHIDGRLKNDTEVIFRRVCYLFRVTLLARILDGSGICTVVTVVILGALMVCRVLTQELSFAIL